MGEGAKEKKEEREEMAESRKERERMSRMDGITPEIDDFTEDGVGRAIEKMKRCLRA